MAKNGLFLGFNVFFSLCRRAFIEFKGNDPLRFGAATAFFTTFALPPIMIILFYFWGALFDSKTVNLEIKNGLNPAFGQEGATKVLNVMKNIEHLHFEWYWMVIGAIFLIFVATTIFVQVQASLNQLWNIRSFNKDYKTYLKGRGVSLGIIGLTGLLFLFSFVSDYFFFSVGIEVIASLGEYNIQVLRFFNNLVSIFIITIWFSVLFKYLPDIYIPWSAVFPGGFFTAILFTLGKILLKNVLRYENIVTIYGASSSLILLLLFIFYYSMIVFYGAAFIKAYCLLYRVRIKPREGAIKYRVIVEKIG